MKYKDTWHDFLKRVQIKGWMPVDFICNASDITVRLQTKRAEYPYDTIIVAQTRDYPPHELSEPVMCSIVLEWARQLYMHE